MHTSKDSIIVSWEEGECSYWVSTELDCEVKMVEYEYESSRAWRKSESVLSCFLSLK